MMLEDELVERYLPPIIGAMTGALVAVVLQTLIMTILEGEEEVLLE